MALASYYRRNLTAASQLQELDERAFLDLLKVTSVGVNIGTPKSLGSGGVLLLDLLMRLLARLYPALSLRGGKGTDGILSDLSQLAKMINPRIEIGENTPTVAMVEVGSGAPKASGSVLFAGSNGWDALISARDAQPMGRGGNPFGSAASACLAAKEIFNLAFLAQPLPAEDITFSALHGQPGKTTGQSPYAGFSMAPRTAVVGLGGVANALTWALARAGAEGDLWLVDPQKVDLGNLQRYVLSRHRDVATKKTTIALREFQGSGLEAHAFSGTWEEFVAEHGYQWDDVLVSLDSAEGRRHVQGSLPRWIGNAWTQESELGISVHPEFGGQGACLSCLYVPSDHERNEDEKIAEALGLGNRIREVRRLLLTNEEVPQDMLVQVATHFQVAWSKVSAFVGRPLRQLYVEGVCSRAILPIGDGETSDRTDTHVPLAHQAGLAGVLLASAVAAHRLGLSSAQARATRIDVVRPLSQYATQPILARTDSPCFCRDQDYREVYRKKYRL